MSFYQNGILISGVNTLPELTRAQYEALPADKRPEYWVCLDEEYEPASSGHTIEDDDGTDMPQENNLQFVGVYTEDDATNGKTKVNIVRPMTKEQYEALTPAQKKGFIRTTDEPDNPYEGDSIKVVADQYFNLTGTGAVYIDIDKDYPVDGYKLIGLTIASNAIGYVAQARIRNASRITGFVQKSNGGVIATSETVTVGVTLIYGKV